MNFTNFHSLGNVIIPTDFHSIIFQRGGSTTNQKQLSLLRGHLARFRWDLHQGCNKGSVLENRLFGGEHGFYDFPYIGNVIIPTWQFKAELSWRVFLRWAQVDLLPSCASLPALWRLEVFGVSSTVWSVRFCIGFDAASKQQEKKQERLKTTQNLSWKLSLGGWTSIYHSISRKKLGAKQKKKPGFWLIPIPTSFLETKVSCHSASMGQGRLSGARVWRWRGIRWVVQVDMGLAKRTSKVKSELVFEATQIHYP